MGLPVRNPHAGRVQHRFRDSIQIEIALDRAVGERHRTERRKAAPGRRQTERLTQMSGLDECRASGWISDSAQLARLMGKIDESLAD